MLKKLNDFNYQEIIDTPPTEIIEENIALDESFIKNKALIRMDMNLIQYPIFSKNTKRKVNQIVKYYFNNNRDTYITVTPSAGDHISGETEERIFIALMKIMKNKGLPKKFIVTSSELKNELAIKTNNYNAVVKKSLLRLSTTNYNFKNTMYSSSVKALINEEVSTPVLLLRILSLNKKENSSIKDRINDNRIKEVYEIEITDFFYKNIITKGYLVYDSNTLLGIETSTARTIYMLIEKLRFNNNYLKIETLYLIKRIPLKFTKSNLAHTIKTLDKNLMELKEKKLIKDYEFLKDSTWEKSKIEFHFHEETIEDKQNRFFEDYNEFKKINKNQLVISHTEKEDIENGNGEIIEIKEAISVSSETVDEILELMPAKAKKLKTMKKTIEDSINKYGLVKVKAVAIYMKNNKVDKVRAYFMKALEQNWIEGEEEDIIKAFEKSKVPKKEKVKEKIKDEKKDENIDKEFSEYLKRYDETVKNDPVQALKIEKRAEEIFLKEVGIKEFDVQRRKIYDKTIKYNIVKAIKDLELSSQKPKDEKKKKEKKEKDSVMSRKEIGEYIRSVANKFFMIYSIEEEKDLEIKMEVADRILEVETVTAKVIEDIFLEVIKKYI